MLRECGRWEVQGHKVATVSSSGFGVSGCGQNCCCSSHQNACVQQVEFKAQGLRSRVIGFWFQVQGFMTGGREFFLEEKDTKIAGAAQSSGSYFMLHGPLSILFVSSSFFSATGSPHCSDPYTGMCCRCFLVWHQCVGSKNWMFSSDPMLSSRICTPRSKNM